MVDNGVNYDRYPCVLSYHVDIREAMDNDEKTIIHFEKEPWRKIKEMIEGLDFNEVKKMLEEEK